jgi:hypothetical protein
MIYILFNLGDVELEQVVCPCEQLLPGLTHGVNTEEKMIAKRRMMEDELWEAQRLKVRQSVLVKR